MVDQLDEIKETLNGVVSKQETMNAYQSQTLSKLDAMLALLQAQNSLLSEIKTLLESQA